MITKKKEWITTKELAKLKGVCDRAVRKSINDNKYVVRKVSRSYEILVTSLEENVREKLTEDEEKLIPKIEENYIVPEDQKQLALAKYDLVKKWNEDFKRTKYYVVLLCIETTTEKLPKYYQCW